MAPARSCGLAAGTQLSKAHFGNVSGGAINFRPGKYSMQVTDVAEHPKLSAFATIHSFPSRQPSAFSLGLHVQLPPRPFE